MYFSLFTLSQNKTNCNRDSELAHHTLKMSSHYLFVWCKVCCFPPNIGGSEKQVVLCGTRGREKSRLCCVATWMPVNQRHNKCSKWPPSVHASSLLCHWLITSSVHRAVLKFSPCLNKPLPQLVRFAHWYTWYTCFCIMPDAAINRVEVRTVGWPHGRTDELGVELGCLTAQKPLICHEHDVLVYCLGGRQTRPQCCVSLAAAFASATRLDSTVQATVSKQLWLSCTVTVVVHF